MHPNPTNAYRRASSLALTPRAAEAEAFAKAIALLDRARRGAFDYDAYSSALRFNQRLWTIVQADLGTDETTVPHALRRDTLNLSLFVDKQTIKALSDPEIGHLGVLIEIDRAMVHGLTPTA